MALPTKNIKLETKERLVRVKEAPQFFGVSRNTFNKNFRPFLTEIPLGSTPQSGIAFDIFEMHDYVDNMKKRNGRPGRKGDQQLWDVNKVSSLLNGKILKIGTLKGHSSKDELEKALEQHLGKKPH